jgi:hypothetical protein
VDLLGGDEDVSDVEEEGERVVGCTRGKEVMSEMMIW